MITHQVLRDVLVEQGFEVHMAGGHLFAVGETRRLVGYPHEVEWECYVRDGSGATRVFVRTEADLRRALTVDLPQPFRIHDGRRA